MAKIELIQVKGSSFFCSGRLSVGVYKQGDTVILVDSGIDSDTAKNIDAAIKAAGCSVAAIINTHHHPDHCGGNNYFQKKYPDLRIFASQFESVFINNPFTHVLCFCNAAAPSTGLRNKYLEASISVVTNVITPYEDQVIEINGEQFRIVTLPGHTFGSIGIITPDNVFYCGDAIFGEDTFNKHGVLFYTEIQSSLASFEKITWLQIDATVFYHGGMLATISATASKHARRMLETKDVIAQIINVEGTGLPIDLVTQKIMNIYRIPQSEMSFALTRTCVTAFITQLELEKKIELIMRDGLLCVIEKK